MVGPPNTFVVRVEAFSLGVSRVLAEEYALVEPTIDGRAPDFDLGIEIWRVAPLVDMMNI